ncbi:hypothetical protein HC028_26050 [Planosporangium flavigriseum]|uniref:Uncharacterized protein n=1 Tax=Planosporangium flavigriseum TaxID=373681 RepID=A0A8J3PNC9_9ACTN|nr:hypothetical protein [Planosporangium flavigriseum]NJC67942.1 hypothetical protein [Planosporangium flavigriseum]GIG76471.1 hypothetical protein Pfl04_48750 [Planosporangium flavigriseum]
MTRRPTLLGDVAELRNVLSAMGEWEAAGEGLDSAQDRRRFVDHLDEDTADELAGLALTNLARAVLQAKAAADETQPTSQETFPAPPAQRSWQRYGHRPVAA